MTHRSPGRPSPTRRAPLSSLLPALLAGLACLLTAACGGGEGGASGATWRFAVEETTGSIQHQYAEEFARRLEERSDGAVRVQVYPYGTLGTSDDLTEQLRMGSLQFCMASPGHLGKTIPELQVLLLHFVLTDDEDRNRAALEDPTFLALLEPLFEERGLELLSILPEGWMVWTTQEPVRTPEDFAGVQIRTMTSPLLMSLYEAYGASPQAMPYGEVYSALQLNMIDAQVNPVFAIEEMSFHEVTECLTFARPAPFLTTLVSHPDFLADLPEEQRAWVDEVVAELGPWLDELQREENRARLDVILEARPELQVVELDEAQRDAFRELSLPVRETYLELAGPRGGPLLEALLAAVEATAGDAPGED